MIAPSYGSANYGTAGGPPLMPEADIPIEVLLENETDSLEEAPPEEYMEPPHDANLAEHLSDDTLNTLVTELETCFDSDLESRKEWLDTYVKGLDLLGIKIEDRDTPWPGACGVTHPMILESAVRFQSKASVRLFPGKGPVAVKIYGKQDEATLAASKRVQNDMNFYCTEKMPEYFPDTEQLLFALPVAGSVFRKVYHDAVLGRPSACLIKADDFVMPAGFPHLETCPRYTHRMRASRLDVLQQQALGYYRKVDLQPEPVDQTEAEQKESELSGVTPAADHNEIVTLLEMHTALDLEGFVSDMPLPYVVTWETKSRKCLAIRRNWYEEDERRRKILHFIHYRYVPGLDTYGYGLIHLIGGIAKSSTSLLRQLIDSGTLANLPGGLKARTLRIVAGDHPIAPGEWRDVDVPGGKISDGLLPLPYKEPSPTLLQLYNGLVQEGKDFASIADLDISSASANAPVGTVLALLERASEVITAVQARLHQSFKQELNLLYDCIRRYDAQSGYDYPVEGAERDQKEADYARRWGIRPQSDPSASTTAQKVMQLQAAMNFSAQSPQIYDLPRLHREMLSTLGIEPPEDLVPDDDAEPMDPVSENMAMTNTKPVKAYQYQDHTAHLAVHQSYKADPELQQQMSSSPSGGSVMAAIDAHISEHMAFQYRDQIEKQLGVPLPPLGDPLPPEVEEHVASIEAAAASKLAQQKAAQAAQAKAQEQESDPLFQLEKQRVQIEQQRVAQEGQIAQADLKLKAQKTQIDAQAAQMKAQVESQKGQAQAIKTQADAQKTQIDAQAKQAETQAKMADSQVKREAIAASARRDDQRSQIDAQRLGIDQDRVGIEQDRLGIEAERAQTEQDAKSAEVLAEAERLRLENERLKAEVLEMRAQLEIDRKKLDIDQQKVDISEKQIRSQQKISKQQIDAQQTESRADRRMEAKRLVQEQEQPQTPKAAVKKAKKPNGQGPRN